MFFCRFFFYQRNVGFRPPYRRQLPANRRRLLPQPPSVTPPNRHQLPSNRRRFKCRPIVCLNDVLPDGPSNCVQLYSKHVWAAGHPLTTVLEQVQRTSTAVWGSEQGVHPPLVAEEVDPLLASSETEGAELWGGGTEYGRAPHPLRQASGSVAGTTACAPSPPQT